MTPTPVVPVAAALHSSSLAATPPFSNYGILTGQLFLYRQGQAAFESPAPASPQSDYRPNKLIVIGGLSDGLLPVPYLSDLYEEVCGTVNDVDVPTSSWSVVQPTLQSSYSGFGHGSLQRDCDEIVELIEYLSTHRNGRRFALLGHSTGCQDLVYFWKHAKSAANFDKSNIKLLILQAPVSDREGVEASDSDLQSKIKNAEMLVEAGQGDEMVPRSYFWTPLTAQRFLDLHQKGGRDDFFSSDFTDDELDGLLSHISDPKSIDGTKDSNNGKSPFRVLVAYSGEDEYVPSHVDKKLLTERLVNAMNAHVRKDDGTDEKEKQLVAHGLFLPTGNHNLSKNPEDARLFVEKVSEMIKTIV
jgi:hypothetical protein